MSGHPLRLLVSALLFAQGAAYAAPSCTDWVRQSDGSYFRTCVDDNGKQYCEELKDRSISRVSCK